VGVGVIGLERQRLLDARQRLAITIEAAQRTAQIVVRVGEVRPQGESSFEAGDGLFVPVELHQRDAETVMSLRVAGLHRDRFPVARFRFGGTVQRIERAAQIPVRDGVARLERKCLAITCNCLAVPTGAQERVAKVEMHGGGSGGNLRGLENQLHRFFVPSLLRASDAEQMQRVGVARFRGEHLPIQRFGLDQRARLVALHRRLQGWRIRAAGASARAQTAIGALILGSHW